jgi:hypothetical protein
VQTSILYHLSPSPRLREENLELCQDARAAKTYRDELDVLRERAEKVNKLEAELLRYIGNIGNIVYIVYIVYMINIFNLVILIMVVRYKDKMNDIDFFKSRAEELRRDNMILVENKEMLEEQLAGSRKR